MFLLVDYRENDYIKRLSEYCEIVNDHIIQTNILNVDITFKITSLPIADYIILQDIDDNNTIQLAIERKSIKDLCSSITDGRFREQKQRLLDSINDNDKICYLIEGNKNASDMKNGLSNTIINGSLLNLSFKHKYKTIQTENKQDTFNMILLLYKKFKNGDFKENQITPPSSIKLVKRSDKIKDNKLSYQLCLIPGVSINIADTIISYPVQTIKELVDKYNSLETDAQKENIFSEIKIQGKNRKIGKVLSKKIYEYFCK
jgi:crossover junction endonuclease MUS81